MGNDNGGVAYAVKGVNACVGIGYESLVHIITGSENLITCPIEYGDKAPPVCIMVGRVASP
jgi:hypothetical protein